MHSGRAAAIFRFLGAALLLASCSADGLSPDEKKMAGSLVLSALGPVPADPSNRFADDPAAAAFGATLFFDTDLSSNGKVACATCHQLDRQFQDGLQLAQGIGTTDRRTMPLAGVAHSQFQFWDGRSDSLWSQALVPLENPVEHGMTRTGILRVVASKYRDRYVSVFGSLPDMDLIPEDATPLGDQAQRDRWVALPEADREQVDGVFANLGKALAAFERSIAHEETKFDRFAAAAIDGRLPAPEDRFSDLELEGLKLFMGKANCIECHNGPRFTDDHFHNTGIAQGEGLPADLGRAKGAELVRADPFNCLGRHSDASPDECVALRFMRDEGAELLRAYKTPSLRGAAGRPPYMHAGQVATLELVVEHYGQAPAAPAGESEIRPVALTDRGRAALVAFLRTLGE